MKNKVDPINVLRVFATMLVFVLHVRGFSEQVIDKSNESIFNFFFYTPAFAGVWIFFIMSGYLAGISFLKFRYSMNFKGIIFYYIQRIIKVGVPYYIFCFIVGVLLEPEFFKNNPEVILRILFFSYNGSPGVVGIGATWFISTIMQLYLVAPIICIIVKYVGDFRKKHKSFITLFWLIILVLGFAIRIILYKNNCDWETMIYKPFYSNLDLFICGIIWACITITSKESLNKSIWRAKVAKFVSTFLLVLSVMINAYIFYKGTTYYIFLYLYVCPSIYVVLVCFYLYSFRDNLKEKNSPINLINILNNPTRIIDFFSGISMEFYFWHSVVLQAIFLMVPVVSPIKYQISLILISFMMTFMLSYLFSNMCKSCSGKLSNLIVKAGSRYNKI